MVEEKVPFTKITTFSDTERNVRGTHQEVQKIITLEGNSDFEQRIYGVDISTPDSVLRTIRVSMWDGVSAFTIAAVKVTAASGTYNNWKKSNVWTPQINGVYDMNNKKSFVKAECKKPFSLFETTQFSMFVNKIDEMGVPYISIPRGYSLTIKFLAQANLTPDTKGVNVMVTGDKIYTSYNV
jgi:hypothetical protein